MDDAGETLDAHWAVAVFEPADRKQGTDRKHQQPLLARWIERHGSGKSGQDLSGIVA